MKKRIVAICLVAVLMLTVFCGCSSKGRKHLDVIIANINTWAHTVEQGTTIYSYAITDLDQNGRLEILASQNYGTGDFTETRYFEISEDETTIKELEHTFAGESQADVMYEAATCYEDSESGQIYYVFNDIEKNGARENYVTKVAVTLFEGKVVEERLATMATLYIGDSDEPTVTYTDGNGSEITAEEYENIEATRFADCEKKDATFGWKGYTYKNHATSISSSNEGLLDILIDSYGKFGVD